MTLLLAAQRPVIRTASHNITQASSRLGCGAGGLDVSSASVPLGIAIGLPIALARISLDYSVLSLPISALIAILARAISRETRRGSHLRIESGIGIVGHSSAGGGHGDL